MARIGNILKGLSFILILLQYHFLSAQFSSTKELTSYRVTDSVSNGNNPKGYFISAEGCYGLVREDHPVNINIINGYLFKNGISAGAGLGIDLTNDEITLPATADFRYFFLNNKKNSPTLNLSTGVLFTKNIHPMGFVFHPSVGIRSQLSKHFFLLSSIGYETGNFDSFPYHFITFSIGVLFK
jgi:hypothetical protein